MLGRLFQQFRVIQDPQWSQWGNGSDTMFDPMTAGKRVTTSSALQLLAVYGCVQFISNTISTMPLAAYRERADAPEPVRSPGWLERPNPETDRMSFVSQAVTSLLLAGDVFVIPVRNVNQVTVEAWVLDPSQIQVERKTTRSGANRRVYYLAGKEITVELIHVPAVLLPGALRGLNPISAARQSIGIGLAAVESDGKLFDQGLMMPGIITNPGIPTTDQLKMWREEWARTYGGSRNAHLPGMLFGGSTWTTIGITPRDAQFLETRQFTANEIIAQMFNLPPDLFNVQNSGASLTYQNIEQRWSEVLRRIMPWITKIENLFTAMLPAPQYAKFNASSYLRADAKTRYETHKVGIEAGFLLRNEARDYEDLPQIDGLDAVPNPDPQDPEGQMTDD